MSALPANGRRRVVVQQVQPAADDGRFAIKRTVGDIVTVTAVAFADGHDLVSAVLMHRYAPGRQRQERRTESAAAQDHPWHEVPMQPLGNDTWTASFAVTVVGHHEYAIAAWVDEYASWSSGVLRWMAAGQDVSAELAEGALLITAAAARATESDRSLLTAAAALLRQDASESTRAARAVEPGLRAVMKRAADRTYATCTPAYPLRVDRERARFGAWYEMFPRSAGPDPTRSATFREAAVRLPAIAALGFDVLYLPPIHPIGRINRKGRGNSLVAQASDPGSPWAIGGAAGGHTAVEPGLGTIEDFDWFREEATRAGLELALDLAYQVSPDHPYVAAHPEWLRHRADGSLKYAENPPKRYQDIYPFDFASAEWQSLWHELRGIVLFWVDHGVRIFRVDNPHTKPFAFWEWLIAEVHAVDADVIFLAEAFTRPVVMRHLAKLGFTQSYTYFTWKNTKAELEELLRELTSPALHDVLRPNFFANTPDILHEFLQTGGLPAFRIRLLLAATLSPTYGIYSGFELGENIAAAPDSEEYLHSEKYEYKTRDFDSARNINDLIQQVNDLRRAQPALQHNHQLHFHLTTSEHLLAYSKVAPAGGAPLLTVVSLDPHNAQEGYVCVALEAVPIADDESYSVRDLLTGREYRWSGAWNYVRLDPAQSAHILQINRLRRGSVPASHPSHPSHPA